MPLTPEDVDNKRFATARVMRQGYDMTEVDNFLDEVAAEMKRLHDELKDLRASQSSGAPAQETSVAQASGSTGAAPADDKSSDDTSAEAKADDGTTSEDASGDADGKHADGATSDEKGPSGTTDDEAAVGAVSATGTHSAAVEEELAEGESEVARVSGTRGELLRVATTEDAAAAAARMLEMAGRNAEELVSDAQSQADRIVSEASGRAEELDGETEQRRAQLVADLERDHQELKDEVEDLRAFEREYRAQLRNYFQQQLEALDAQGGGVTLAEDLHEDEGEIGSRLRTILAEESEESGQDAELEDEPDESAQPSSDTGTPSTDTSGTDTSGTDTSGTDTPDAAEPEARRPTS